MKCYLHEDFETFKNIFGICVPSIDDVPVEARLVYEDPFNENPLVVARTLQPTIASGPCRLPPVYEDPFVAARTLQTSSWPSPPTSFD